MSTLEQGTRVERGDRIILGSGFTLDQAADGTTILGVAPGISSIGVQDANSGPDTATRLVFQGTVVSVDPATGVATFDLDSRYQLKPPAGYSWAAGSNKNVFTTPFGSISLGPQNSSFAHIYADLPFYFNQQAFILGGTVWHSGNDGASSGLDADLLDGQHGSYYQPASTYLSRVGAPITYGSLRVTGSTNGWAGIEFADGDSNIFMSGTASGYSGVYHRTGNAWRWEFDGNGTLIVGTIPWARLSGINQTLNTTDSPTFAALTLTSTLNLPLNGQVHWNNPTLGGALVAFDRNQLSMANAMSVYPSNSLSWGFTEATDPETPLVSTYGGLLTYKIYTNNAGMQMWFPYDDLAVDRFFYRISYFSGTDFGPWYTIASREWANARFALGSGFTINQNLRTTDSPTFVGVKATDWFRNTANGKGLFNEANNYYWFADSTHGRWISRSGSGIELMDESGVTKGYLLFSGGFGLCNSTGSWSVKCNDGAIGGSLFGDWTITGIAYATRFVDGDNVGRYLDPAGTSILEALSLAQGASMGGNLSFGSTTRQMVSLYGTTYGIGVQSGTQYFRTDGNFAWFIHGAHSNTAFDPGVGGSVLAKLDGNGSFYAARYYDITSPGYYLLPSSTSVLYGIQINYRINSVSATPLSMDIAAGGSRYPYIEWKYGGVRGAYMGWGTPGTQLDLTLENGNKLYITGNVYVSGGFNVGANGIGTTGGITATGDIETGGTFRDQWTEAGGGIMIAHVISRSAASGFDPNLSAPDGTFQAIWE